MPAEHPFRFLEQLAPQEVADRLAGEMAFVQGAALCQMSPVACAKIMACMADERRREVAAAMSKSRQMPTDVLADIADELRKKSGAAAATTPDRVTPEPPRPAAADAPFSGLSRLKSLKPLTGWQPQPEEPPVIHGVNPVEATVRPPQPAYQKIASAGTPAPSRSERMPDSRDKSREDAMTELLSRARDRKVARTQVTSARTVPGSPGAAQTRKAGAARGGKVQKIDGMALAAHILREAGGSVLHNVKHELPDLYQRLHQRMFDFSDLERTSSAALGAVFTGIEAETAALALRFASDSLREKVFAAVSPRRAELLREEMAADKSRVRLSAIDEAQQAVIGYALKLQDSGRLLIDPSEPDLV